MTIRILLADDQALVRGALAALLNLEPDLQVVAEVGRGDEVLDAARQGVDVCVLDIEMPGQDGIGACQQIVSQLPDVKVLIVTTFARPGYLRRALEAGALGYVVKDIPADELAAAVRRVAAGEKAIDPALAGEALRLASNPLTAREQDVLRHALTGAPIAVIARELHLSEGTVRNYLSASIAKTGAATRVDAAQRASANGWL